MMLISNIIMIISFILDGVLTNFLPYMVSSLSIFTPLTTLTALVIIYPFFYHKDKKYFITAIVVGLLYDLFYTNLLFFNAILFFIMALVVTKLYRIIGDSYIRIIVNILLIIVLYELLTALIIFAFNLVPVTIERVLYKIGHSLILNLIYGEILYVIVKKLPKKYHKTSIN